jgi:hypothetical protein
MVIAEPAEASIVSLPASTEPPPAPPPDDRRPARAPAFNGIWELARALNRADRSALAIAAEDEPRPIPVDGLEVRKLLGTFWFRSVFPLFSVAWRERLLTALVATVVVPNHVVRIGRQVTPVNELGHEQIKAIADNPLMRSEAGADLRLLSAIGSLWGADALTRVHFGEVVNPAEPSRFATLLSGFRP